MGTELQLAQSPLVERRRAFNAGEVTVIGFLFAGSVINYMDRTVFGVLAPLIRKDLSLDASQMGWALGLFALGYGLLALLGGWSVDHFGAKRVLVVAMTAWSVLCGMTGLAMSLVALLIIRFFFGIAECPFVPATSKAVSNWFSRERYAAAIGITFAGQPLGGALAGPLLGLTVTLLGWRASFAAVGCCGLTWALVWALFGRDTPSSAARPPIQDVPAITDKRIGTNRLIPEALELFRQPAIIATAFSFATATYVMTFVLTWFPSYLTGQRGVTQLRMSMITAFPWLLAAIGQLAGGFLSDFLQRRAQGSLNGRKIVVVGSALSAGVCVALVPAMHSTEGAVGMMTLASGLLCLSVPNYYAIINEIVAPRELGGATGILVVFATVASFTSPVFAGYLIKATANFSSAFILASAISIAGAAVFALWGKRGSGNKGGLPSVG